jgi:CheY-like chemotaxis protein
MILIVEDNGKNIFALTAVLKAKGFKSMVAENGKEALTLLKETPDINLVLMDIMMPVMDGYETIKEIRKMPAVKNLPVIAVTARALPGDEEKCLEAGANAYLSKPINADALIKLLKEYI